MMHIMDAYGYLGIALLILVENLFPPIPSEVILTFGGFMTTYT
ncbi:MAG: DedA family protein, partial [Blautia marasmi]